MAEKNSEPVSPHLQSKAPGALPYLVFLAILAAGLGSSPFLLISPAQKAIASKSWQPTACTILSSRLDVHHPNTSVSDSNHRPGPSHRLNIQFSYLHDGTEHRATTYNMTGLLWKDLYSGLKRRLDEIIAEYPPGKRTTCYVNPDVPAEAVIQPGFSLGVILLSLVPLTLIAAGASGLASTARNAAALNRRAWEYQNALQSAGTAAFNPSSAVLLPSSSRGGKLVSSIGTALVWNGFFVGAGFLLWQNSEEIEPISLTIGLLLVSPLLLIGLLFALAVVVNLLSFANPTVDVSALPGTPRLGGKVKVSWKLERWSSRVRELKIFLVANRRTTYRDAAGSSQSTGEMSREEVAVLTGESAFRPGEVTIRIPDGEEFGSTASPSEEVTILWELHFKGQIPYWPNLDERYSLPVLSLRNPIS